MLYVCHNFSIDDENGYINVGEDAFKVKKELAAFKVLCKLCETPGSLVDENDLLKTIRPSGGDAGANVRVNVTKARDLLEKAGVPRSAIENDHRKHYFLDVNAIASCVSSSIVQHDVRASREGQPFSEDVGSVGRKWLIRKIIEAKQPVTALIAPAGFGKTTISRMLASQYKDSLVAYVKCRWDSKSFGSQEWIIEKLYIEVAEWAVRHSIVQYTPARDATLDVIASITAIFSSIDNKIANTHLVILDAIDELDDQTLLNSLLSRIALLGHFNHLRIIVTTRAFSEERYMNRISVIKPDDQAFKSFNDEDIRLFAKRELMQKKLRLNKKQIDALVDRSQGNFQYATLIMSALSDSVFDTTEITNMPDNMILLYELYMARLKSTSKWNDSLSMPTALGILRMIAVSQSPLPMELIGYAFHLRPTELDAYINLTGQLLRGSFCGGSTELTIFHKSFADYLLSEQFGGAHATEEGRALLTTACCEAYRRSSNPSAVDDYLHENLVAYISETDLTNLTSAFDIESIRSVQSSVLNDESFALACIADFEDADDVKLFNSPAKELSLAHSAYSILRHICSCNSKPSAQCVNGLIESSLHLLFVHCASGSFEEAYKLATSCTSLLEAVIDKALDECDAALVFNGLAKIHETLAYDVLAVGQPQSAAHDLSRIVYDHYDKSIDFFRIANNYQGYAKAVCNKALYEAERGLSRNAVHSISSLLLACNLKTVSTQELFEQKQTLIANPLSKDEQCEFSSAELFNHYSNLGYCLTEAGRELEALKVFSALQSSAFDSDGCLCNHNIYPHDAYEMLHLSSIALYKLGDCFSAIENEEIAIEGLTFLWGESSTILCASLNLLGSAYLALNDPKKAVQCFERSGRIAETRWPRSHRRFTNIQINLAESLVDSLSKSKSRARNEAAQDLARAEGIINDVIDNVSGNIDGNPWAAADGWFLRAERIRAKLLFAKGASNEAISLCERLEETYRSLSKNAPSRSLGTTLLLLGSMKRRVGDIAGASLVFDESAAILSSILTTRSGSYTDHPIWLQLELERNSCH